MTQLYAIAPKLGNLVPPEEPLKPPPTLISTNSAEENKAEQAAQPLESRWLVVAKNRRVNRDWEALLSRAPENARRCYEDLCTAPTLKKPGRVFNLRGKHYKGAWEYEVTGGERVFYVPHPEARKVLVYYAGEHPKKSAPLPP